MALINQRYDDSFEQHWWDVAHRWSRHAEHLRNAPVLEEEAVQLGGGPSEWTSLWACGIDALLTHSEVQTRFCAVVVPHPDWIAILAPTSVSETLRINGWHAEANGLFLSTTADGYCVSGGARAGFALGLRKSRLVAECCALSGIERDDLNMRDLEVSLGRAAAASLHMLLWGALADSMRRPVPGGLTALSPFWEGAIFARVAQILSPLLCRHEPPQLAGSNALRIVRAAEAACADLACPPTMTELCAAAGVGERWLRKCFFEVRGASPAQFLLMRRLSAARDRLVDPNFKKRSVKDVALSLGFLESGRFSQYYKDVFGERPSETLERSKILNHYRI